MERAYLITKDHFRVEEVNFTQLKETIDNIILEYRFDSDLEYFKRSLFEMDRLGYNIGILVKSSNISTDSLLSTFISYIKGFEIKLGVWVIEDSLANINNLDNKLYEYKDHFITGFVTDFDIYVPRWGQMGDIEDSVILKSIFIQEPIRELRLNTDYKKIYEENNLKPIPSTYKL